MRLEESIYFYKEDLDDVMKPQEDPLVIRADISHDSQVKEKIIDNGSSTDILYMDTFLYMGYKREDLSPYKEAIYRLTNTTGVIDLGTSIRSKDGRVRRTCQFVIVEMESTFISILRQPFNHDIKVVPSSYHQCMWYLENETIATIKGQQFES